MALSSTLHLVPPLKYSYLVQQRKQLAPRSSFSQLKIKQLPSPKSPRSDVRCCSAVSPDSNGAGKPSDGSIAAAISPSVTKFTPSPQAEENGIAQGPPLLVAAVAAAGGVEGETALPIPPGKQAWISQAEGVIERVSEPYPESFSMFVRSLHLIHLNWVTLLGSWLVVTSFVQTIRTSSTDLTIDSGSIAVCGSIVHGE